MHGKTIVRIYLAGLLILCFFIPAQGHVPLVQGGNQHGAVLIPDALKSWAIYGAVHENGEVDLYQFEMNKGDRLVLSLLVPRGARSIPSLVVMGRGIPSRGMVPPQVTVPPGVPAMVVEGMAGSAPSYEPFSPASFVEVAQLDTIVTAQDTYTVVVYKNGTGPYGLAIGYLEEFTPSEWLLIPLSIISIRFWEGQPPFLIFGPLFIVLGGGLAVLLSRRGPGGRPKGLRGWLAASGGLLCIGSGITTLFQMGIALRGIPVPPEVAVTLILAIIPVLIGAGALRVSFGPATGGTRARAKLLALAAGGFISWAGFLAGPVLLLFSALVPEK